LLASGSGCFHPVFFLQDLLCSPVACRFPRKPSVYIWWYELRGWDHASSVEPYHFWLVMPFDGSYWHQKQWCWTGLIRPCPYQASGSVVKVMIRLLGKEASIKTLIQSLAICLWPFLYFQERALSRCCSAARHCWQGMTEALIELNRHAQW
jgi:hypothetical protein